MARLIKKFFYAINIFTIIFVVFIILFSTYSIRTTYKFLEEANSNIEKKYNESIDDYKEVITFVLKNKLPQGITYFNSIGNATYNLPEVKEFQTILPSDILIHSHDNQTANDAGVIIAECVNNECISVVIDPKKILNKISKSDLWKYGEITAIPLNKSILLQMSINSFLDCNHSAPI